MTKHKKTAKELTDDELLDSYCFYLEELSSMTKLRDVFGMSKSQVNLKLIHHEMMNRQLIFRTTEQRN